MKKKLIVACGALLLACATLVLAQDPDFSGTWKLNAGKSDFGDMAYGGGSPGAPPPDVTLIVRKDGNAIVLETRQPAGTTVRRFTTDGKESTNAGESYKDLKGSARFGSGKLVVRSEEELKLMRMTSPDDPGSVEYVKSNSQAAYELSADGKTLTVTQTIDTPFGGARTIKKVFDRA